MSRLDLTTNPGLEDLVCDELRELASASGLAGCRGVARPGGLAGWSSVEVDAPAATLRALALRLRSVHHVVEPVHAFELEGADPLGQIQAALAALPLPELEPEGTRFRVTCHRSGDHAFTSEDVERAAGAGIRDRAWRPVSLRDYQVNVRVDVRERRCTVGIQLTRRALSERHERASLSSVALRANVAWAMLRLASPDPGRRPASLLDPFCGSGTILLEAGSLWPDTRLHGCDASERAVLGARANLAANRLDGEIRVGDVRDLASLWPGRRFDAIVSNPPFGRRVSPHMGHEALFGTLLDALVDLTEPGTRVALLVLRRAAFNRALGTRPAFVLRHARIVEIGGLHPAIVLLERVG
jgi:putative N6-adenine-specific DNA methylase/tRNA (guanine6-N2)-methyltransferase